MMTGARLLPPETTHLQPPPIDHKTRFAHLFSVFGRGAITMELGASVCLILYT